MYGRSVAKIPSSMLAILCAPLFALRSASFAVSPEKGYVSYHVHQGRLLNKLLSLSRLGVHRILGNLVQALLENRKELSHKGRNKGGLGFS
eukprot:2146178-Pyramimonas_sp.AAC.1